MCACQVTSVVSDSLQPRIIACHAPLSVGFSRQEYWSELPCPPLVDLPDPGTKTTALDLLHWQASSLLQYHLEAP